MTRSSPAAAASDVSSDAIAATPRDAREERARRRPTPDRVRVSHWSAAKPQADSVPRRARRRTARDEKYRRHPDRPNDPPPVRPGARADPPAWVDPLPRAIADSPRRASRSPTTRARRCPSTARTPITSPRRCARVRRPRARATPRARRTAGTSRHLTPARARAWRLFPPPSLPHHPLTITPPPPPPTPRRLRDLVPGRVVDHAHALPRRSPVVRHPRGVRVRLRVALRVGPAVRFDGPPDFRVGREAHDELRAQGRVPPLRAGLPMARPPAPPDASPPGRVAGVQRRLHRRVPECFALAHRVPERIRVRDRGAPLCAWDVFAAALVAAALILEAIADEQQWAFQQSKHRAKGHRRREEWAEDYTRGFRTLGSVSIKPPPQLLRRAVRLGLLPRLRARRRTRERDRAGERVVGVSTLRRRVRRSVLRVLIGGARRSIGARRKAAGDFCFRGRRSPRRASRGKYPEYAAYRRVTSRLVPWWPRGRCRRPRGGGKRT